MIIEYQKKVNELKDLFDEFMDEADKGKEGRGSKTAALKSRKLSTSLAYQLKEFRSLSIANDRSKPTKKRE